jgi:hypothetical protein
MTTALIYPQLHKFAVWLVDKIILRRVNYEILQIEIARAIEKRADTKSILDEICEKLAAALTASEAVWNELPESEREINLPAVGFTSRRAEIFVPTGEAPFYEIYLNSFTGGRNLLSDEIQMLEAVGLLGGAAHRQSTRVGRAFRAGIARARIFKIGDRSSVTRSAGADKSAFSL